MLINATFLSFLKQRLYLLKRFLSERGSIYVHIDKKIGHYVKVLMDEVFGYKNFVNDITRITCNPKNFRRKAYGNVTDMILYYVKQKERQIWNDIKEKLNKEEIERLFPKQYPEYGRYTTTPIHASGETKDGDTGLEWKGLKPPHGRHWRYTRAELTALDRDGKIEWSPSGNPRKMVFARDHNGKKLQDVWEMKNRSLSYTEYPTEENIKYRSALSGIHPGLTVLF